MPTQLGQRYSTLWRGQYPHMLKEDFPVWEAYINRHAAEYIALYYDVRVGSPAETPLNTPEKMVKMWYDLNAKRIDVVAEQEDTVWIIEVATRPGLRALGQLTTYLALWLDDPVISKPAQALLVAHTIDKDLLRAMEIYGMHGRQIDISPM